MSEFAIVAGRRIEIQRIEVRRGSPEIVFLHEGLGSVAMWRDFPERLAGAAGYNALLYSRYGYGRSDALAEVLEKTGIEWPVLFGHSDGASIALIYASAHPARAVIALAPHVFVEQMAVDGVAAIRRDYEQGGLRQKLARYHDHPDSAFYGWNDIWLAPEFRAWCIEEELARISIPVLAVQGYEDEYGTIEQLERMRRRIRRFEALKLAGCRHSPHRDQPEAVIGAARRFLQEADTPNGRETAPLQGH